MELHQCINFLLSKAQQSVYQHFKTKLAEYDVTPVQYGILACLWQQNGQAPSQIAANLNLDSSTITGILDRMENKGLLKRTPDPGDRRALKVVLTEAGSALQEPIDKIISEANEEVMEGLSLSERETLNILLGKLGEKCSKK